LKGIGLVDLLLGLSGEAIAQYGTFSKSIKYSVPTAESYPSAITVGANGAVWFTEYPVPNRNSAPDAIAAGLDGGLWFAEQTGNNIGRVTTSGTFTEYAIPTALAMDFNPGIDTPATFDILVHTTSGAIRSYSKEIPAVVPPCAFTLSFSHFPNVGTVTVEPTLAKQPGGERLGLCSEWITVNMGQ